MSDSTTMQLAGAERGEFVELLAGLSPQQWDQPSLCTGWRVHDVVAHVVSFEELSRGDVVRRFVKGGLIVSRINAIGVAEYVGRSPAQLTELMRACIPPRGFTAGFGGMIALVDGMIHQQDIRRPLGMTRAIPSTRVRTVLEYALRAPLIRGGWAGIRSGGGPADGDGRTAGRAETTQRSGQKRSGTADLRVISGIVSQQMPTTRHPHCRGPAAGGPARMRRRPGQRSADC